MFEIETLKAKKLADLQEIAATLKITRYKTLKKQDLIYQILDLQAQKPEEVAKHEIKEKSSKVESTGNETVNEDQNTNSKRRPRTRTQKTPTEGVHRSFQEQSMLGVLFVQTSPEFAANNIQTYKIATSKIDIALKEKSWTAALEQGTNFSDKPPAIIVASLRTSMD